MPKGTALTAIEAKDWLETLYIKARIEPNTGRLYFYQEDFRFLTGSSSFIYGARFMGIITKRTGGKGYYLNLTDSPTEKDAKQLMSGVFKYNEHRALRRREQNKTKQVRKYYPRNHQELLFPVIKEPQEPVEEPVIEEEVAEELEAATKTPQTPELLQLKKEADALHLTYHPNIGYDTLRKRLAEARNARKVNVKPTQSYPKVEVKPRKAPYLLIGCTVLGVILTLFIQFISRYL